MKKYMSVVFVLMLGGLYAVPARADSNGDQTETPASMKQAPVAGSAQSDVSGAPKLVVEFQTAQAVIPSSYSPNLKAFGKYLTDNPGSLADINGYADHTGHGPANAALAQKRADVVKNYLVTHCAVASSRITAEGYGEVSTKTRNDTEAGKQTSRSAIGTIVQPKS
jgi:outer membrane protein OmpA-like peptidoglycan-associated protein